MIGLEEEILPDEDVVDEQQMRLAETPPDESISFGDLPDADRVGELFNKRGLSLPIVQTVTYKKRVPWLKGRSAWVSDYASHYKTSRHFIARSLNGTADYDKQDVADGDRFNVFSEDKNFEFYLVVDVTSCRLWFYYHDLGSNERVLLKSYDVGLGRLGNDSASSSLTPLGTYRLGDKIATYRPKTVAYHQGKKTEMIQIFGTRWIPFIEEIDACTDSAKGYGIHGIPWIRDKNGQLVEEIESLRKYESDGCIRLATNDMEELFAIIITRPTTIEIVQSFHQAHLPGVEKKQ